MTPEDRLDELEEALEERLEDFEGCSWSRERGEVTLAVPAEAGEGRLAVDVRVFNIERDPFPFADGTFDLVVANQLLPWIPDTGPVFREVARVLRKGGVFAFATLGPDSLRELAAALASVDQAAHVNRFEDMHNIGDGLVRAGLADPVLDVDRLAVSYESVDRLFADLTLAGARNALCDRPRSLVGRARFRAMKDALTARYAEGQIVLDLELVYGHCWGTGAKNEPGEFRIDANGISLRR